MKVIGRKRICDGTKIKRGQHWDSCVDVCNEEKCPQKLIKFGKQTPPASVNLVSGNKWLK